MPSLTGDICVEHERATGRSLTGSFFALHNVAIKAAYSIGLLLTGFLLNATGFDIALGDAQRESTLTALRFLNATVPSASFVLVLYFTIRIKSALAAPQPSPSISA